MHKIEPCCSAPTHRLFRRGVIKIRQNRLIRLAPSPEFSYSIFSRVSLFIAFLPKYSFVFLLVHSLNLSTEELYGCLNDNSLRPHFLTGIPICVASAASKCNASSSSARLRVAGQLESDRGRYPHHFEDERNFIHRSVRAHLKTRSLLCWQSAAAAACDEVSVPFRELRDV
jgi:hypothetical protein